MTKLILYWCLAVSLVDFCLMGMDKYKAKKDLRRVPEKRFFLLALLGGTPGAILGMWTFRHKTRHWYFRWGLPVLLTLQLAMWFGWEYGEELL